MPRNVNKTEIYAILKFLLSLLLLLLLSTSVSAQSVAVEGATFRDWLNSGREHPGLRAIDRDLADGRITRAFAVEQQLRLIAAPQTVAAAYAGSDEPIGMKCLTPLLIEAEHLGIDTGDILGAGMILDAGMMVDAVQNEQFSHVSPYGFFEVFYYKTGPSAVDTIDNDTNGVPDYIDLVAFYADSSFKHQVFHLGYKDPLPTMERIRINVQALSSGVYGYVRDLGKSNATIFIQSDYNKPQFIKNDDEDKPLGAAKVTVAHELKHILQGVIRGTFTQSGATNFSVYGWIEMDATMMEEMVFPNVNDYYNYLGNSQSTFRLPERPLSNGSYYHAPWALYFQERFGNGFWPNVWKHLDEPSQSHSLLSSMMHVINLYEANFSTEIVRNYMYHVASGDLSRDGYGFKHSSFYPNFKFEKVFAHPDSIAETNFSANPNNAARAFLVNLNGSSNQFSGGLRFYIKTNSESQVLNVGFLGFYDDGGVQEFFPSRTNPTELLTTPPFDYSRLTNIAVIFVNSGSFSFPGSFSLKQQLPVALDEDNALLPYQTAVLPNYPNPFNPSTSVPVELSRSGNVTVEVIDLLGRRVAVLADGFKTAGRHVFTFDAAGLSSGMYIVRLSGDAGMGSRKVTLLK